MALNQGVWAARSVHNEAVDMAGRIVGAGAAPCTVPTDNDNAIASSARSGVGTITATLKTRFFPFARLLSVSADPVGATGLEAAVLGVNAATGVVSLQLKVGATATDATTADTVYIRLKVRYSTI